MPAHTELAEQCKSCNGIQVNSSREQRIAVVTGSRSEYGLLYWILRDLQADSRVELQLIVTGMHLSPEFGLTVREIERDSIPIARRIEMLLSSDSPGGMSKSFGLGVIGLSDAFEQLEPDVVLVLGDRFEILSAAQVALFHNIPVAHIAGGDTTEGAIDESIRHSITKMSHLHLVTNELSARRVRQLGEDPNSIHVVGSPGLDHLNRLPLLDRKALSESLGAPLGKKNLLITFHPVTLEPGDSERQFGELLAALDATDEETRLWFTKPNADTGGRALAAMLDAWASSRQDRVRVYESLGHLRYLSLMRCVDAVVGNSSSGLYEAPSFHVPTVNIGNRQAGRLKSGSVIDCAPVRDEIVLAVARAQALDCAAVVNPYGDGHSSTRIVSLLRSMPSRNSMLSKHFHMVDLPIA